MNSPITTELKSLRVKFLGELVAEEKKVLLQHVRKTNTTPSFLNTIICPRLFVQQFGTRDGCYSRRLLESRYKRLCSRHVLLKDTRPFSLTTFHSPVAGQGPKIISIIKFITSTKTRQAVTSLSRAFIQRFFLDRKKNFKGAIWKL